MSLLPGQFSYELSEVCILGKCCIIVQLPADALVSVLLGGLLRTHPQLSTLLSNTRGLEQVTSLKVVLSIMTVVTRENDKAMKDILVLMSLQFTLCKHALCALQV